MSTEEVAADYLFNGKAFKYKELDSLGIIYFDLQGENINKFTLEAAEELGEIAGHFEQKKWTPQAIVLFSAKKNSFIVGADINLIKNLENEQVALEACQKGQSLFNRFEDLEIPCFSAIHGACMGGGTELSLAMGNIICSDYEKTMLGLPEVKLGLLPGWGGTFRLPKKIGLAGAFDVMLSGKNVRAKKAEKIGLAMKMLPKENFEERVCSYVSDYLEGKVKVASVKKTTMQKFLDSPLARNMVLKGATKNVKKLTRGHYPAPMKMIELQRQFGQSSRAVYLEQEAKTFAKLWKTSVSKNLVNLFFMMEDAKKETGSSAVSEEQYKNLDDCKHLGVLGAGVMGGGIAAQSAKSKIEVIMKDINYDGVNLGYRHASSIFSKSVKRRRLTKYKMQSYMDNIQGQIDYNNFKKNDLVIEAVVENVDVKKSVFKELSQQVSDDCIIATNTSSICLKYMKEAVKDPSRFVGIHFFNPVEKMPLVEVIVDEQTSPETIARAMKYCRQIGKTPVVVKDGPGFLVNRLLVPWLNEACHMVQDAYPIDVLDIVLKDFGMPMGPCELIDEVGIDVGTKVVHILHDAFGERALPAKPMDTIMDYNKTKPKKLVLGKKSGLGMYRWTKAGGKKLESNKSFIEKMIDPKKTKYTILEDDYITKRMMYPMVNEAAIALSEGIVEKPWLCDLAMIFGTGFAPFRGGLLRYADAEGLNNIVQHLTHLSETVGPRFKPSDALKKYASEGGFYR